MPALYPIPYTDMPHLKCKVDYDRFSALQQLYTTQLPYQDAVLSHVSSFSSSSFMFSSALSCTEGAIPRCQLMHVVLFIISVLHKHHSLLLLPRLVLRGHTPVQHER
jgi:hypothetical protein